MKQGIWRGSEGGGGPFWLHMINGSGHQL